ERASTHLQPRGPHRHRRQRVDDDRRGCHALHQRRRRAGIPLLGLRGRAARRAGRALGGTTRRPFWRGRDRRVAIRARQPAGTVHRAVRAESRAADGGAGRIDRLHPANLLLVLGLSFTVGGLRHGAQNIDSQRARATAVLMLLAVAAMVVPSLASYVHTPAAPHEDAMSMVVAVILLVLFAVTLPASLKSKPAGDAAEQHEPPRWPLPLALALLAASAIAAAFVSEWFVHALKPAMAALHISDAFAGLVIVAIAGNAVENVVGIQLAAKNR